MLEAMDVHLQGGGTAMVREWVRLDLSPSSQADRATRVDILCRQASLPLAAALAEGADAGTTVDDATVFQSGSLLDIMTKKMYNVIAFTSTFELVFARQADGTYKILDKTYQTFVEYANSKGLVAKVPVVDDSKPFEELEHPHSLQGCKWKSLTYEQWIRWHFDNPNAHGPITDPSRKSPAAIAEYEKLAYNVVCFLREAWPRGSRFSVDPATYYSM
nr:hypothetical protein [Candidatus Sigynarchaeota archaeon]